MTTVRILTAALMCSALALSACQKKAEPAADAAAPAADAAAAPADGASMTATAGTPAECNAYLDHVAKCTDKLSSSNAMAAEQMRKSAEQTRASWAGITDQAALASACTQADAAFATSATAMGC